MAATKLLTRENFIAFQERYTLMVQVCQATGYYPPNVLIEAEHIDNLIQWLIDAMKEARAANELNRELMQRIEELEHEVHDRTTI